MTGVQTCALPIYALQLARRHTSPITATADGLLARFKANDNDESDSKSSADGDQL